MMFGNDGIFSQPTVVAELMEQQIIEGYLSSTGNFSFSSANYAEGDEFIVIAFASSGGGAVQTVQSGWTTVDTATYTAIWRRTLGASDNPNSYTFQTTASSTAGSFIGFIVRGASTFTGTAYYTTTTYNMTVSSLGNPAIVMAGCANPVGTVTTNLPSGYDDLTLTQNSPPDAMYAEGGSEEVTSGSATISVSTFFSSARPGAIIAAY